MTRRIRLSCPLRGRTESIQQRLLLVIQLNVMGILMPADLVDSFLFRGLFFPTQAGHPQRGQG